MRASSLTKVTALLSVAAFAVAVGGKAYAANLADADQTKCRATIAKNVAKLASTISKAYDGCIKDQTKLGSGNCQNTVDADNKGKVAPTKVKFIEAVGGIKTKCDDTLHAQSLAQHAICGTPVGGALTSFAGVGKCLAGDSGSGDPETKAGLVDANVERWRASILNPDYAEALADKDVNKCIGAIGKNATKLLSTIQKEVSKGQNTSDKALGDENFKNNVSYSAPGSKIDVAKTKLFEGIQKACEALTPDKWAAIRSCDDDWVGVAECVTAKTIAVAEGLIASAYDQPGKCPGSVKVAIHHAAAGGEDLGTTDLDVGFTGLGHNAEVIDDFIGRVELDCGAATGNDCTACSATVSCAEGNCRCSNDVHTKCGAPFTVGGPCGIGTCEPYFGPPLPLAAGGAYTCVVNKITSDLVSNADISSGESDSVVSSAAHVYATGTQIRPCPTCENNQCVGGARAGLACSPDGHSDVYGDTSYDCPPTNPSISGASGLKINLNLTTGTASLNQSLQCDGGLPFPAFECGCNVCSLDVTRGCSSNADCTGFGTCTGPAPLPPGYVPAIRTPTSCNTACEPKPGSPGEGQCNGEAPGEPGYNISDDGPFDKYCDGFVKGSGEGILGCSTNGDCDTYGLPLGQGGNCTIVQRRACFLDTITADGSPGSEGSTLVSTFCSAPTTNSGVNNATGSPGPGRVALDFEFYGKCDAAALSPTWGPGGANCQY